jgi:hypothetical protein
MDENISHPDPPAEATRRGFFRIAIGVLGTSSASFSVSPWWGHGMCGVVFSGENIEIKSGSHKGGFISGDRAIGGNYCRS